MTIGKKIKAIRLDSGMTQIQFGKILGMPDSQIGGYERDERKPTKRTLEKISSVIGITYEKLVENTDMAEENKYCGSSDGREVECCSVCDNEIELRWDINTDGFQAICPICGSRLMLCDACNHRFGHFHDDCDYDSATDKCRFSRPTDWWRNPYAEEEKR